MLSIEVEDAPFVATDMVVRQENGGPTLAFRLNTDELVIAGPDHPIIARGDEETPAPATHISPSCDEETYSSAQVPHTEWVKRSYLPPSRNIAEHIS